ncbi:hypothetical protein BDW69DRAFT_154663 [Aspergillus filifer]
MKGAQQKADFSNHLLLLLLHDTDALAAPAKMPPADENMLKRRRLLRGEVTYSAAKERETNILHAPGYWGQQQEYF